MKQGIYAVIAIFLLLLTACNTNQENVRAKSGSAEKSSAYKETLVTLKTRPGVEQKFILLKPKKPVASVILFAGGKGALNLDSFLGSISIGWGRNNFLVRTRAMFAGHGFIVAVVDAPSDRQGGDGMLYGFRNSLQHVQDIDAVISYLRKQANVPVWLVGTSRGTESAAYIAIHSHQKPHGIVLSSSMSEPNRKGMALEEMDLKKIRQPTLIVQHQEDECFVTPPSGARAIAAQMRKTTRVKLAFFKGGNSPLSGPCNALSNHGFFGIENSVVQSIARFIRVN